MLLKYGALFNVNTSNYKEARTIKLVKKLLDSSGDEGSRDFCKSETNEKLKIW